MLMLVGVCACTHRYECIHRYEPVCALVYVHVCTKVDMNTGSSRPLWFYFLRRDQLANLSLISHNATIFYYLPHASNYAGGFTHIRYCRNISLTITTQEKLYLLYSADGETKLTTKDLIFNW